MFGFAGWNFIGASSAVLRDQGGNIILNMFCGPAVNAARGIALQVSNAIQGFVSNFMTALNPQITKSYAAGEHDYMMSLIYKGARFSYYILLMLSLPVIVNARYILTLWLLLSLFQNTYHYHHTIILSVLKQKKVNLSMVRSKA